MGDIADLSALEWLRPEIDKSLSEARSALEGFIEQPEDSANLLSCVNSLQQVRGALEMLEVPGPTTLAAEMQALAQSLFERGSRPEEDERPGGDAYDGLIRAILVVPNYLEWIRAHSRDLPIAVLPLINELRGLHGVAPMEPTEFFEPTTSVLPGDWQPASDPQTASEVARRLRPLYEAGLVAWLRGHEPAKALGRIVSVADQLKQSSYLETTARFWWLLGALAEALRDHGVISALPMKRVFGHVDVLIRRLGSDGEQALSEGISTGLVKALLYEIAQATSSGPRVSQVREAFKLRDLLPSPETLERIRQDLAAPTRAVLEGVLPALQEDLAAVKDGLDLAARRSTEAATGLQPIVERMLRVADTLQMLGFDESSQGLREHSALLALRQEAGEKLSAADLSHVAGTVLQIERAMTEAVGQRGGYVAEDIGFGSPDHDVQAVVIRQARSDLSQAMEAIEEFFLAPGRSELLDRILLSFRQIHGALSMLGLARAIAPVKVCQGFVETVLMGSSESPAPAALETLADTLAGLEQYLGAVEQAPGSGTGWLEQVEQKTDMLRRLMEGGATAQEPGPTGELTLEADRTEVLAGAGRLEPQEETLSPVAPEADLQEQPAREEDLAGAAFEEAASRLTEEQPVESVEEVRAEEPEGLLPEQMKVPEPRAESAGAVKKAALEGVDADLVEVFLEEADGEVEAIGDSFERWRARPDDEDSLRTLRRSFHTLKGSGRMVGASDLGEFAWAFENMLNRVLDGTVPHDERIFELAGGAVEAVSQLVAELKGGAAPTADVQGLAEQAHARAQPELTPPEVSAAPPAAQEPVFSAEPRPEEQTVEGLPKAMGAEARGETLEIARQPEDVGAEELLEESLAQVPEVGDQERLEQIAEGEERPQDLTEEVAAEPLQIPQEMEPAEAEVVEEPLAQVPEAGEQERLEQIAEGEEQPQDLTEEVAAEMPEKPPESAEFGAQVPQEMAEVPQELPDIAGPVLEPAAAEQEAALAQPEETRPLAVPGELVELEPELAEIFFQEATEILEINEETLASWREVPGETHWREELQRSLHTLKGSARMAGVGALGDLAHSLESLLVAVVEGRIVPNPGLFDLLQVGNDRAAEMLDALRSKKSVRSAGDFLGRVEQVLAEPTILATVSPEEPTAVPEVAELGPDLAGAVRPRPRDEELRTLFFDEAERLAAGAADALEIWEQASEEQERMRTLQEALQALVSGARVAGVESMAQVGQAAMTVCEAVSTKRIEVVPEVVTLLQQSVRLLKEMPDVAPEAPIAELVAQVADLVGSPLTEETALAPLAAAKVAALPTAEAAREGATGTGRPQYEQVRVRADRLDGLVNLAGEVSIYRARLDQHVHGFHRGIDEFEQTTLRLGEQLRRLSMETEAQLLFRHQEAVGQDQAVFDPLELDRYSLVQQLSRSLSESVSDLDNIRALFENLTRDSEVLLVQQGRVHTELQEGLMHTRMLPFAVLTPRLNRIVRQLCQELGKHVELRVHGGDHELDRAVLDKIVGSLEHILRNAVDHGMESSSARKAAGKPEIGLIDLNVTREGSEVVIAIRDDGAGMDVDAIRRKAVAMGLMEQEATISEQELMQFIVEPGFSTASRVSQVSGRGVGLDVVDSVVKQLGGGLTIRSRRDEGSMFLIRLPLMLSITQALIAQAGEEIYAIPLGQIQAVTQVRHEDLVRYLASETPTVDYAGTSYQFVHLGTLLGAGDPQLPGAGSKMPLLLLRTGDQHLAVQVESIIGRHEIVVKPLGLQLSTVRGLLGATILGDGRVALILDTGAVVRRGLAAMRTARVSTVAATAGAEATVNVMVVDDSITMRKVTARLLERHRMRVVTAKDGVDALERLQEEVPDVMVLDIEMPRMDGYELARHIRRDPDLRHIPIVMVTSRIGEKHRQHALSIGVNRYLGKPYQESELLDNIKAVLAETRAGRGAARSSRQT